MTEENSPVHEIPSRQKTEGELVLEYIDKLHKELETLQQRNDLLEAKINKELPAQLDRAFGDIQNNFTAITKALEAIGSRSPTVAAAAAQGQQSGGSIMGVIENIIKRVTETPSGGVIGGLSELDKETLKLTKQIQIISLRDVLKKTAKAAGVELPIDHMVINP
jgi:hypothetical protein